MKVAAVCVGGESAGDGPRGRKISVLFSMHGPCMMVSLDFVLLTQRIVKYLPCRRSGDLQICDR